MAEAGSSRESERDELRREYQAALRRYVDTGLEAPLSQAWDLARRAFSSGRGLASISEIHQAVLQTIPLTLEARSRAAEFFAEALAPFEMMLRGYREAAENLRVQHEALRQANAELERQHGVISAQRDALIEAERKQHEISAFVVHDLKNPLAVIQVNLQYVLRDPEAPDAREALQDALGSSERLGGMVANLLDVYRGGEGRLIPRLEPVAAEPLLREIERRLHRRSLESGQRLEVHVDAGVTVMADRDLLHRVVENLADNAAKHTPRNGLIRLCAREDGEGRLIEVSDTGRGIPDEQRRTIFDKFVQLAPDGAPRASHGLGLLFCKLVAEAHGGRIWVDDNPEGGCSFRLWLPAAKGAKTEPS